MTSEIPSASRGKVQSPLRQLADAPVSPHVAKRLADARRHAVAHARHGSVRGRLTEAGVWLLERAHARSWTAAALIGLVLMVGTGWYWHQREAEYAFDQQMLTDEIPLEMLVNGNFDTWHAESR
ncbi:DUF3619 family protein [Jeongeupia naejangsanensis]|uniref:DUF3619 family protein n=1 Tax=Jeongeupia naejangsanensis TaxID=613195 RepID=A0ABS2BQ82_9NEIS|nr:DUF3619 family protein [Jeongeupia naejangsanensis]MBM3117565.1 DUF3619 family protein [Jeongeupia naejangsanensis]